MKLPLYLFLILFSFAPVAAQKLVISAQAGTIKNVQGEVFYRCYLNDKEVLPLERGLLLHDGDTVLTTERGSAAVSLNPDSYLVISADSFLRVVSTDLSAMHFDIERGEILLVSRSLKGGASLIIHAPPVVLAVHKRGNYRIFVSENGNTEANIGRGELRYVDDKGKLIRIKKGKQINFVKREKAKEATKINHYAKP